MRSRKRLSASKLGTYGVCEMSNKFIPHARLEAIPFARFTVECQQQLEKENRGRRRWDTAPQFMDSAEAFSDEEEESIGRRRQEKRERLSHASSSQTHAAPPPYAPLPAEASY